MPKRSRTRKKMTSVTLSVDVLQEIDRRGGVRLRSRSIDMALRRYYTLMSEVRRVLAGVFDETELRALCAAYPGLRLDSPQGLSLAAQMADALAAGVGADVKPEKFLSKLRILDRDAVLALIDTLEEATQSARDKAKSDEEVPIRAGKEAASLLRG
jgi:hypothetical protein